MGKLHELLAVEGDLEGESKKITAEAVDTFNKRDRFEGHVKTTKMLDEARKGEETVDYKAITTTVAEKLAYVRQSAVRYLDAFLQKETTNQTAKADLVVDGVVLAKDVPATALLGLESKLKSVRAMYEALPTLAPGVEWEFDAAQGVYKVKHPEERFKTEKSLKFQIMVPATDKHPAQVEKWTADVPIGKIIEEKISGMISPVEKSALLGRIDTLIRAVKKARQRANSADVVEVTIGTALFDYIHAK
jgi:hypothetical protein